MKALGLRPSQRGLALPSGLNCARGSPSLWAAPDARAPTVVPIAMIGAPLSVLDSLPGVKARGESGEWSIVSMCFGTAAAP